jgi:DNA (cytosine-5)-methyltransferase 1
LKLLDLFSGIGGFHLGLTQAGFEFDWVGFSEIDKYAKETYSKHFPDAVDLGDVRTIRHEALPEIDIITFGSPCQDFSIAGKRSGLGGDRSSLIGEAIRLIADLKPHIFIWENVKGTFSSNNGEDFWAIIQAFSNIGGYRLEWQLLNTRWFLPQNRERIYLVGHLGEGRGHKVFPIGEDDKKTYELQGQSTNTITARDEAGQATGSYVIESELDAQKGLKQIGTIGKDSEATRVYDTTCARTIKNGGGMGAKTGLYQIGAERGRYNDKGKIEQQLEVRTDDVSNTLTGVEKDNRVISKSNIRRLTPTECERLQGFPDGWTEGQSDTQRYKQLGNAVSVPVVRAVAEKLKEK